MRAAAVAVVMVVAACSHEPRTVAVPVKDPPTCDDLEPDHAKAVAETQRAFEQALAAKGLTTTKLPQAAYGLHQGVAAWTVFDLGGQTAIASEVWSPYFQPAPAMDLVKDAEGAVWHVRRAPRQRVVREEAVKACTWGCWGQEPSGVYVENQPTREVWLVPAGERFGGEITVEYDAPTVVDHVLDMNCPMPP